MISSVSLEELYRIINSEHNSPHDILGMHIYDDGVIKRLCVRTFIPAGDKVKVVNVENGEKYKMKKIHEHGFFEIVFKDTDFFKYELEITYFDGNVYTVRDQYSFLPTISDFDCYLFGEGTHYSVYDKLGAHLDVVEGVAGVKFAVWAPSAKRVSVIGEFNSWDGRTNMMRNIGSSGIFEIFVPNLTEFTKYKFEIKTQNNDILEKTDPYGNFQELRPSHTSLVTNLDKYEWKDQQWLDKRRKENTLDRPINVYEIHMGSWRRIVEDGNRFVSYNEYCDLLIPYLIEMGYTHVELMPVEEHPFDGSWGYQVTGYYAPTSRFGSPDEFMHFVDMCHQNGIGVILDWVPAHFPKDAHGLARFDGTALYEHADPRQGEHPDWGTYIFNFGRKEVKNFLIANAIFWIEKFHIDGLRVDAVASMLYLDYGKSSGEWVPNQYGGRENLDAVEFLKHMNSVILGRDNSVLMIAEESTSWPKVSRPVEHGGLGFNLKWNMGFMNDFLRYIEKDPIYRKYSHNDLTFGMVYAYTENFIQVLSHDEVVHGKKSMINKMPGDLWQKAANLKVSYGYMYGHPGKKLLFMGGEFGQFDEWNESTSLQWNLLEYEYHQQIQRFVKDLNNVYKDNRAFWYDDFVGNGFEWIEANDYERSTVSFVRKTDKDKERLVIVCNFTPVPLLEHTIRVKKGTYVELLNSDDLKYGGSGIINSGELKTVKNGEDDTLTIKLPPLAVVVLRVK